MKKIIKGRAKGKTTDLIKMSHDTNTYILVNNRARQKSLFAQAREMNIDIPYPVTIEDYMRTRFQGSFIKSILIDDADDVLQAIFSRVHIDAITLSKDEGDVYE